MRLALAALLAASVAVASPDAGTLGSCPDATDAPPAVELDGGWWLPNPRGPRLACRLSECQEQVRQLEQAPSVTPTAVLVTALVAFVAGMGAGGYVVWRLAK